MHDVGQLVISLAFCLKRRLSVRLKLVRIPKGRIATGTGDLPKVCPSQIVLKLVMLLADAHGQVVYTFIEMAFLRSCALVFEALPEVSYRERMGCARYVVVILRLLYFCSFRMKD